MITGHAIETGWSSMRSARRSVSGIKHTFVNITLLMILVPTHPFFLLFLYKTFFLWTRHSEIFCSPGTVLGSFSGDSSLTIIGLFINMNILVSKRKFCNQPWKFRSQKESFRNQKIGQQAHQRLYSKKLIEQLLWLAKIEFSISP